MQQHARNATEHAQIQRGSQHRDGGLVVKLARDRVDELVASGVGRPFAPAGRTFREWVSVPDPDPDVWRALLIEGATLRTTARKPPR